METFLIIALSFCCILCWYILIFNPNRYLDFVCSKNFTTTKDNFNVGNGSIGRIGVDCIDGINYLKCKYNNDKNIVTYMDIDSKELEYLTKSIRANKIKQVDNNCIIGFYKLYKIIIMEVDKDLLSTINEISSEIKKECGIEIEKPNYVIMVWR